MVTIALQKNLQGVEIGFRKQKDSDIFLDPVKIAKYESDDNEINIDLLSISSSTDSLIDS